MNGITATSNQTAEGGSIFDGLINFIDILVMAVTISTLVCGSFI